LTSLETRIEAAASSVSAEIGRVATIQSDPSPMRTDWRRDVSRMSARIEACLAEECEKWV
jgi:hypothetical protein